MLHEFFIAKTYISCKLTAIACSLQTRTVRVFHGWFLHLGELVVNSRVRKLRQFLRFQLGSLVLLEASPKFHPAVTYSDPLLQLPL